MQYINDILNTTAQSVLLSTDASTTIVCHKYWTTNCTSSMTQIDCSTSL